MGEHYYLKADWQEHWTEVSLEEWIKAERGAGFWGPPDRPATGGFSSSRGVSGKIAYEPAEPAPPVPSSAANIEAIRARRNRVSFGDDMRLDTRDTGEHFLIEPDGVKYRRLARVEEREDAIFFKWASKDIDTLLAAITAAEQKADALERALKPFADAWQAFISDELWHEDERRWEQGFIHWLTSYLDSKYATGLQERFEAAAQALAADVSAQEGQP